MADLTTAADVKTYLGITSSSDDALLAVLVTAASGYFETMAGRAIVAASATDTFMGDGAQFYVPDLYPVQSVTSLAVAGVAITEAVDPANDDGWYLVDGIVRLRGSLFTEGKLCVLGYTGGYEAVPADVAQAVKELVALKYRERQHVGSLSQSIAGQSVSYLPAFTPRSVTDVIDAYRKPSL